MNATLPTIDKQQLLKILFQERDRLDALACVQENAENRKVLLLRGKQLVWLADTICVEQIFYLLAEKTRDFMSC